MTVTPDLDAFLDAALAHVPFDGWTETTFAAAAGDLGLSPDAARALAPRGAIDLAVALHRRGDAEMVARLAEADLSALRYSERVVTALQYRIEAMPDREAVRRATTLFSLPAHAATGANLIWGTADAVWIALGDTSRDGNWYSKRAILSAVWGSTVLFWLGDESVDHANTDAFIERRISDVMKIETVKGQLRANPLTKPLMELKDTLLGRIPAPRTRTSDDLPGRWTL